MGVRRANTRLRRAAETLSEVAKQLGLAAVASPAELTASDAPRFAGALNGLPARLALAEETIDLAHHPEFSDLFQRHGSARMPFARLTLLPEVALDPRVCFQLIRTTPETIEYGPKEAIALLDHTTRSRVRLGDTLGVFEDHVRFDALMTRTRSLDLELSIRAIATFCLGLVDPDHEPLRTLEERAHGDPSADVRARAVEAILSLDLAEDDRVERVVKGALADPHAEVQFAAARRIGSRGFDTVETLAESHDAFISDASGPTIIFERPPVPEEIRERAFVHAARNFPAPRAQALLLKGLDDPSWTIQFTVLSELADKRFRPCVPELIRAAPRVNPPALARYAETLGDLGNPSAQAVLLEILSSASIEARTAAADGLGRIGDRTVLPALGRALLHASTRELRLAIATAIDLVRTRSGESRVGGLTLTSTDEDRGALAMAPGRGELSMQDVGE
ncbi:MAG: HEAT repeat domain-containing protein [Deltaproteobacteria bacterium]|nr:HEAT repeat domain-containing protein [Deltaproteobacteria bacterium]